MASCTEISLASEDYGDVVVDCDLMVRDVFVDNVADGGGEWRFFDCTYAPPPPGAERLDTNRSYAIAVRPLRGTIRREDGTGVELAGHLWRQNVLVTVTLAPVDGADTAGLESELPAAILAWPGGLAGIGKVTREERGDARVWRHEQPSPDEGILAWLSPVGGWPLSVEAEADAEGVRLSLSAIPSGRPGRFRPKLFRKPMPSFLVDEEARYQPWETDVREAKLTPSTSAADALPPPVAPTSPTDPAEVVNAGSGGAASLRMRLLSSSEWRAGRIERVPATVLPYLDLPEDTECLSAHISGDRVLGNATAGLLLYQSWGDPAPYDRVQWVLGEGWVGVTRYPLRPEAAYERHLSRGPQGLNWRVADDLIDTLGHYGQLLSLVPVNTTAWRWQEHATIRPRPGTPYGLYGESTVGEQPWGKCRIYVDPAILHIVFDLPEEQQ